jgi:hypothetical protein
MSVLSLSLLQPGGLLLVWEERDTRQDLALVFDVVVTGLTVRYVQMGSGWLRDQCILGPRRGGGWYLLLPPPSTRRVAPETYDTPYTGGLSYTWMTPTRQATFLRLAGQIPLACSIVPDAYVEGGNMIVTRRHVFLGEAAGILFRGMSNTEEPLLEFMTRTFHRPVADYILLPQAMYHIDLYLLYVGHQTFLLPHPDTLVADSLLARRIAQTRDILRMLSYTVCEMRHGFVASGRVGCLDELDGSFFNSLAGMLADGVQYLLCPSYGTTADSQFIGEVRTHVHNAIVLCVGDSRENIAEFRTDGGGLRCQTAYSQGTT